MTCQSLQNQIMSDSHLFGCIKPCITWSYELQVVTSDEDIKANIVDETGGSSMGMLSSQIQKAL